MNRHVGGRFIVSLPQSGQTNEMSASLGKCSHFVIVCTPNKTGIDRELTTQYVTAIRLCLKGITFLAVSVQGS